MVLGPSAEPEARLPRSHIARVNRRGRCFSVLAALRSEVEHGGPPAGLDGKKMPVPSFRIRQARSDSISVANIVILWLFNPDNAFFHS